MNLLITINEGNPNFYAMMQHSSEKYEFSFLGATLPFTVRGKPRVAAIFLRGCGTVIAVL
jgi:hypothetical protein